jgi:hypothetical protein
MINKALINSFGTFCNQNLPGAKGEPRCPIARDTWQWCFNHASAFVSVSAGFIIPEMWMTIISLSAFSHALCLQYHMPSSAVLIRLFKQCFAAS